MPLCRVNLSGIHCGIICQERLDSGHAVIQGIEPPVRDTDRTGGRGESRKVRNVETAVNYEVNEVYEMYEVSELLSS